MNYTCNTLLLSITSVPLVFRIHLYNMSIPLSSGSSLPGRRLTIKPTCNTLLLFLTLYIPFSSGSSLPGRRLTIKPTCNTLLLFLTLYIPFSSGSSLPGRRLTIKHTCNTLLLSLTLYTPLFRIQPARSSPHNNPHM